MSANSPTSSPWKQKLPSKRNWETSLPAFTVKMATRPRLISSTPLVTKPSTETNPRPAAQVQRAAVKRPPRQNRPANETLKPQCQGHRGFILDRKQVTEKAKNRLEGLFFYGLISPILLWLRQPRLQRLRHRLLPSQQASYGLLRFQPILNRASIVSKTNH